MGLLSIAAPALLGYLLLAFTEGRGSISGGGAFIGILIAFVFTATAVTRIGGVQTYAFALLVSVFPAVGAFAQGSPAGVLIVGSAVLLGAWLARRQSPLAPMPANGTPALMIIAVVVVPVWILFGRASPGDAALRAVDHGEILASATFHRYSAPGDTTPRRVYLVADQHQGPEGSSLIIVARGPLWGWKPETAPSSPLSMFGEAPQSEGSAMSLADQCHPPPGGRQGTIDKLGACYLPNLNLIVGWAPRSAATVQFSNSRASWMRRRRLHGRHRGFIVEQRDVEDYQQIERIAFYDNAGNLLDARLAPAMAFDRYDNAAAIGEGCKDINSGTCTGNHQDAQVSISVLEPTEFQKLCHAEARTDGLVVLASTYLPGHGMADEPLEHSGDRRLIGSGVMRFAMFFDGKTFKVLHLPSSTAPCFPGPLNSFG